MFRHILACTVLTASLFWLGEAARGAEPTAAEQQFAKVIHAAIIAKLPKEYEDRSGWGKTVPITEGVRLPNLRTRIKVGDHEEWPDGGWNRVVARVDDPAKDIVVKVSDVHPSDHKTTLLRVETTVVLRIEEEHKQWQKGLLLIGVMADARAVVLVTLDVDASITLDRTKFPPDLVVVPTVTKSQVELKDFELFRGGRILEGERLRDILKGVFQTAMTAAEPQVTEQLNQAITRALKENKGPISGEQLLKDQEKK